MATHSFANGILDSNGRRIPLALVTAWDRHSVRILCPYCLVTHCHGTGNPPWSSQTRESHCYRRCSNDSNSRQYQLCYPYEDPAKGDYSYEIDKEAHRFVTVGVVVLDEEKDEDEFSSDNEEVISSAKDGDGELPEKMSRLAVNDSERAQRSFEEKSSDRILEELYRDPSWRLDMFFSCCINGDIADVKCLIATYGDPFTESKNEQGDSCISLAAVEGHTCMVRVLHENGADVNNVNRKGKTPLMEAALWGRLGVVEYLLANGANPSLEDRKGRRALFYARPSNVTTRMRERHDLYVENSEAESNRRIIALRLQPYETVTVGQYSSEKIRGGRFILAQNSGQRQITYYEQNTTYNVPDEFKAIARLDRGRVFPTISAASGWRTDFAVDCIIDNRLWMGRVRELGSLIDYNLSAHMWDGSERPGSYLASHAEKKLIAYYIDKHMVLPNVLTKSIKPGEGGEWAKEHFALQDLAEVQPEFPTVFARVYVSREVCEDCRSFVSHVEKKLGISFRIEIC